MKYTPLKTERDGWRKEMDNGTFQEPEWLQSYRNNRDSEFWRMSRQAERVCEYVMWLEDKLRMKND